MAAHPKPIAMGGEGKRFEVARFDGFDIREADKEESVVFENGVDAVERGGRVEGVFEDIGHGDQPEAAFVVGCGFEGLVADGNVVVLLAPLGGDGVDLQSLGLKSALLEDVGEEAGGAADVQRAAWRDVLQDPVGVTAELLSNSPSELCAEVRSA